MRRTLALVLCLCGALLGTVLSAAQAQGELEERIEAFEAVLADRAVRLERLETELSTTNTELDTQLGERDRLSAQVLELSAQGERIRQRTRTLERQQEVSDARVVRLTLESDRLKGAFQELIVNLHRRGSGRYVGALARTESLFRLRVRNDYLARLTAQDVALLDTLDATTAALNRARAERERQVAALGRQERDLAASTAALGAAQGELEAAIAALSETRAGQLAQQETLLLEQSSLESELTDARTTLAAELERRREEAARAARLAEADPEVAGADEQRVLDDEVSSLERLIASLEAPAPPTAGEFTVPFAGASVARPYAEGGATDVWLRAREPGTAVRAVRGGVVYRASVITANSGFTVAVRHAGGLVSAYTNLQPPLVTVGDEVAQGQILGYLGGGIISADILQLRVGQTEGFDLVYQDPVPLLGLSNEQ